MNEQDQEIFNKIVKSNPEELVDSERKFLRARRSYLNHEQERVFADVLAEKPQKEEATEIVSYKDLQTKAADLGIKSVGVSREDLEKAIAEKEA